MTVKVNVSNAAKVVSKKVLKKALKAISKSPDKAVVVSGYVFQIVDTELQVVKSGKLVFSGLMSNLKDLWKSFISFLKLVWAYVKSFFERLANFIAGNGFKPVSANKKAPKKAKKGNVKFTK